METESYKLYFFLLFPVFTTWVYYLSLLVMRPTSSWEACDKPANIDSISMFIPMTHRYPAISALESPPLTLINRSPQDGPLMQLCALIWRIYRFDQDFTSTRSHSSKVYLYEGFQKMQRSCICHTARAILGSQEELYFTYSKGFHCPCRVWRNTTAPQGFQGTGEDRWWCYGMLILMMIGCMFTSITQAQLLLLGVVSSRSRIFSCETEGNSSMYFIYYWFSDRDLVRYHSDLRCHEWQYGRSENNRESS
jgi:hypothetical protein